MGIWVSYVTSCYVTSCSVSPGSSVALGVGGRGGSGGGGEGGGIAQYIFTIRKQHTVNKGTRVQGNGSEHFRGVVFSYSFSIYCAAYHGIWCSEYDLSCLSEKMNLEQFHFDYRYLVPIYFYISNFLSFRFFLMNILQNLLYRSLSNKIVSKLLEIYQN